MLELSALLKEFSYGVHFYMLDLLVTDTFCINR